MECVVEGALKSSFTRAEMVVTLTEDLLTLQNHHFPTDDFFVDDLLDFSKVDDQDNGEKQKNQTLVLLQDNEPLNYNNDNNETVRLSLHQHPQPDNGSELCVPVDDVEDLEWLSNFVDESSTGYSLTLPAGELSGKPFVRTPVMTGSEKPVIPTPVQTKARSKRARTGFRVWSLGSHSLADSSSSSTSSSTNTASYSPSLLCDNSFGLSGELVLGKPEVKKQKRKVDGEMTGGGGAFARRCSHCHVTKTPQWRTGPLGAKTLCNACGVRFKSGRLFPEYRPACSPTFSSEIHSNSHRKVLEMRRKKEEEDGDGSPVQWF